MNKFYFNKDQLTFNFEEPAINTRAKDNDKGDQAKSIIANNLESENKTIESVQGNVNDNSIAKEIETHISKFDSHSDSLIRMSEALNKVKLEADKLKEENRKKSRKESIAIRNNVPEIDLLDFLTEKFESYANPGLIEEIKLLIEYLEHAPYTNKRKIDDELLSQPPSYIFFETLFEYLNEEQRDKLEEFLNDLLEEYYDENDIKGLSDFNNYEDD